MSKRAILFDIDGTLVDSNEAHVTAWQRAFREFGFAFDRATIHDQVGKGGDNLVPSLIPDAPESIQDAVDRAHGEIYKSEFLPEVKPFPRARELLRRAAEDSTVLLASSSSRQEVDHYVQLLDAADLLSGTTSKDDVAHSKPCPDIFEKALEKAAVAAGEAIVVGDTPYDLSAANKLGIDGIAVRSGGFPDGELRECRPIAIYNDAAALLADYEESPLSR